MKNNHEHAYGGCMCGNVRFRATGNPFWIGHCHCESCRRSTGAPVVTFVGFKKDQISFDGGKRQIYKSSPGVSRSFCGKCGTPLAWEGKSNLPGRGEIIELYVSTFEDPDSFEPINHFFYTQKISWFDVADDLPRYHGFDFDSEEIDKGSG